MDFSFTDEQLLLAESLQECLMRYQDEIEASFKPPYEMPMNAWQALADNGFLAIGFPEEFGGTPADVTTQQLVNYTIAKYGGPLSGFYSMGLTMMHDLRDFGTEEQRQLLIPQYLAGGKPFCLGMTEPSTGSDLAPMETSYVWDGDEVVINGHKHYNTIASQVNYTLLLAKDAKIENVFEAVTMFLVPNDTPGIEIHDMPKFGGPGPLHICEIFLKDVRLPKTAILGAEHMGLAQSSKNFEMERIGSCPAYLAAAETALEDACEYAQQRIQFGKPIGKNELVQEMIFEMNMKVELMRALVFKAAWMMDAGMSVKTMQSTLKYFCVRAACEVIDDCMQVLGGVGVVGEHRVMRMYHNMRPGRIGAGSDQVMIFQSAGGIMRKVVADIGKIEK